MAADGELSEAKESFERSCFFFQIMLIVEMSCIYTALLFSHAAYYVMLSRAKFGAAP
jgi:hypothetical protein